MMRTTRLVWRASAVVSSGGKSSNEPRGELLPGYNTQVGLRFVFSEAQKVGPNRLYLHLTSTSHANQQSTVAAAFALGEGHLDVGQLQEGQHVVMADPEGNEFCVIELGNSFLAGCGFLGELACDGTREVGHFWSKALGWSLVWDEDQEIMQSPHGGTKASWGGPPVAPKHGSNRQRFDLVLAGRRTASRGRPTRRVGGPRTSGRAGVVELADPDGNEFSLNARLTLHKSGASRFVRKRESDHPFTLLVVGGGVALVAHHRTWPR